MARTEPTIANYDAQSADEITQRLRKLSQADLAKLETYERQGQGRTTVLERIAALRSEAPWSGYDEMEVEEVNSALRERDGDAARRVLAYERQHKGRTTIIELAELRRDASDGSSTTPRRSGRTAGGSQARGRQRSTARSSASSKSGSGSKRSTRKSSSASSRKGSATRSASRSTGRSSGARASGGGASGGSQRRSTSGSRSTKSSPRKTRAKSASRPTATRASGSRPARRPQGSSASRSKSGGASRSRAQARSTSRSRSSRSGSRARPARQTAPARVKQRVTGALRSAATDSRDAVGTTARDTGQAVGTAAKKARGPAIATGAVAAALGSGLVLGSKLLPRRRILGIPIPGRRSRLSQATKSIGKARKGILEAGDRVDAIGKQVSAVNEGIQKLAARAKD